MHDPWEAYTGYEECAHAFCNAHPLRELTGGYEQEGVEWASLLKGLLVEIKGRVDAAKEAHQESLPWEATQEYRRR